jgi:hypothetical protein
MKKKKSKLAPLSELSKKERIQRAKKFSKSFALTMEKILSLKITIRMMMGG